MDYAAAFEKFGSYLDSSNKTTDLELEKENFSAAGEILASDWGFDNFPNVAKWQYCTKMDW